MPRLIANVKAPMLKARRLIPRLIAHMPSNLGPEVEYALAQQDMWGVPMWGATTTLGATITRRGILLLARKVGHR